MLIYQTTDQAVIVNEYRWAYVRKNDKKIKWQNRFTNMVNALAEMKYYLSDETGILILDSKGLQIPNREWTGEIHHDVQKLITDLNIGE